MERAAKKRLCCSLLPDDDGCEMDNVTNTGCMQQTFNVHKSLNPVFLCSYL
jgi:hypothetical protein